MLTVAINRFGIDHSNRYITSPQDPNKKHLNITAGIQIKPLFIPNSHLDTAKEFTISECVEIGS